MTARPLPISREPARWGLCGLLVLGLHGLAYALLHAPAAPALPVELPMLVDLAPEPAPPSDPAPPPEPAMQPDPPKPQPPTADPPPEPEPEPPPLPTPPPVAAVPLPDDPAPPLPHLAPKPPPPQPRPPRPPVPRPPQIPRQAAHSAPDASAAPPAETAPSPPPSAVASPTPADPSAVPTWQGRLMRRLHEALRYPAPARAAEEQGIASVTFTMTRDGHVLSAVLARSSGHPSLDAEAVAMIHRAEPLPPPPADLGGATLTLSVPVQFSLRDLR